MRNINNKFTELMVELRAPAYVSIEKSADYMYREGIWSINGIFIQFKDQYERYYS